MYFSIWPRTKNISFLTNPLYIHAGTTWFWRPQKIVIFYCDNCLLHCMLCHVASLEKKSSRSFFFQFYHSIISEWMLINSVRGETSRRDRYTSHILFMWAYIWFYILYMYIHVYKCEQQFFKFYQSINDEPINQS